MKIDLTNPQAFTLQNLKKLIASEDDTVNTQFRIDRNGYLFLSKDIGILNLDNIVFRLSSMLAGNGYVGIQASDDIEWVTKIYNIIKKNYPNPSDDYCDLF